MGLVGLTCALKHSSGNIGWQRLWLDTQQPQARLERVPSAEKEKLGLNLSGAPKI